MNTFPFIRSDQRIVSKVVQRVRKLLRRTTLTPLQVVLLGKLLFAIEHLPRVTTELAASVQLTDTLTGTDVQVVIDDAEFSLRSQGQPIFAVYADSERIAGEKDTIDLWLNDFADAVLGEGWKVAVKAECEADDELDWDSSAYPWPWDAFPDTTD